MSCSGADRGGEPTSSLDELARRVVDAAYHVHRTLGAGFAESVYELELAMELGLQGIAFQRQVVVPVTYKGTSVGVTRLDMLVDSRLVVELKSTEGLAPVHLAQLISYSTRVELPPWSAD